MLKKVLTILFIFIILGVIVVSIFMAQTNKTDKILLQELEYKAISTFDGENEELGSYNISYDFDAKILFETKNYDILIDNEEANIYNRKAYYFSEDGQLIQYTESEKYNGIEEYKRTYSISYDKTDHTTIINRHDNLPEIIIPDTLPYTVNSSYVLSLGLKDDFSLDQLQNQWSCYEGPGAIDKYTLLNSEPVDTDIIDANPCAKIEQKGLFKTIFWLNSDGYIVQIEQQMDDNYSVIFKLASIQK